MEDDFEQAFADELEILRDGCEDSGTPARRALTLDSPALPHGVNTSRKRPMEDSPLPFAPLESTEKQRKHPRLTTSPLSTIRRKHSSQGETVRTSPALSEPAKDTTETSPNSNGGIREEKSLRSDQKRISVVEEELEHRYPPPSSPPLSPNSPLSSPFSSPLLSHDNHDHSPKGSGYKIKRRALYPSDNKRSKFPRVSPSTSQSGYKNICTPNSGRRLFDSNLSMFDKKISVVLEGLRTEKDDKSISDDGDNSLPLHFDSNSSQMSSECQGSNRLGQLSHLHVLTWVPTGPHISVTSSEGCRVYLRLKNCDTDSMKKNKTYSSLLSVPFAELKANVEEERRRSLIEKSEDILQDLKSSCEEEGTLVLFDSEQTQDEGGSEGDKGSDMLWVDKYSPRSYTELLSDDGINRTLLSWLRLWDEVVFGCPPPLKNAGDSGPSGHGPSRHKASFGDKRKRNIASDTGNRKKATTKEKKFEKWFEYQNPMAFADVEALDEARKPKLKLALLCGPPGLGKTTLAHIIARHAGYNVVEMNASDDRSPELFKQKIEAATQMKAVLALDNKPNCLVIDEIDGAPTAAINILVDLVKQKEQGKKKGKVSSLSRPIICICNDQYAPSLRQLRQQAVVLLFPPTIASRLASRLQQVFKKEGMKSTMSTLIALCEKTDNDIRACLNSIQFIGKKHRDLTLGLVQKANIGQKDSQMTLFSLWKEVFQLPTTKKHILNHGPLRILPQRNAGNANSYQGLNEKGMNINSVRFYNMASAASATGEYSKVANGLFENYLLIKFKDPNMEAISLGQDWMIFNDAFQQHIAHNQDYFFMNYLPYLSVAFHFLFAAPSKPQIKYPNSSFEMLQKQQRNVHLLSSLMLEMSPDIKRMVSPCLLAVEILPLLSDIISPTFRPVSIQLYSSQEKRQFSALVDTMISYSLTYNQEKGFDGQYTYLLEPNVEGITRFPGLPQRKQLTYSAKQLIAREIGVEKLRRVELILTSKKLAPDGKHRDGEIKENRRGNTPKKEIKKKTLIPNIMKVSTQEIDFFGRKTVKSDRAKTTNSGPSHSLWFRFNEGFSNAVRRPVRIKDLL